MKLSSKRFLVLFILLIGVLAVPSASAQTCGSTLKLFYPLDNSVSDSSGCGNDGTNSGAESGASGVFDGSYSFAKDVDDQIQSGYNLNDDNSDISVALFFEADDVSENSHLVASKDSNAEFLFRINNGASPTLQFSSYDGNGYGVISSNTAISTNTYYCAVGTYSTSNGYKHTWMVLKMVHPLTLLWQLTMKMK